MKRSLRAGLARHPRLLFGAGLLAFLVLFCLVGPWLAAAFGLDATTMRHDQIAAPPSAAHWFGTDQQGRELLVRVMLGGRVALALAAASCALTVVFGTAYGALAAYAGGLVDAAMMRAVDALYALPTAALVLVVMATFDARGTPVLVALLAAISWMSIARVVRAHVRGLRQQGFIEAARALGATSARVVWRHLVPNTAGLVAVYATLALPQLLFAEAFLSFLGLGVQPPLASLGTLVTEGTAQLLMAPWMLAFPGLFMAALVLALLAIGDGLRDLVDPARRASRAIPVRTART
jgi:oligopeptide transport system permease protein